MNIQSGTISTWNEEKGFGFISPQLGGRDIFAHITDYSKRHHSPFKGLEVHYFISTDQKGRKCAVEVRPLKRHKKSSREFKQKIFSSFSFIIVACMLFLLYISRLIPLIVVGIYAIMSVITFLMYAKDMSAAGRGAWRTPENTLHMLSLFGGWPGALVAQSFLRHKSKKLSFIMTYWITVVFNCGTLYWLITPKGSLWLKSVIRNINLG